MRKFSQNATGVIGLDMAGENPAGNGKPRNRGDVGKPRMGAGKVDAS